ncbi:MAG: dihydroneopterin aldolase [Candidatus Omnitrophica bacterium]|nr:dihydroneopterin aldolase [Candidatus Omnitrophota bacterium]
MAFADPSPDCIHIRDLSLRCIIGIYKEERREKQDVVINLVLYCDLREAGEGDDLKNSVDYNLVTKSIIAFIKTSSFGLIESLAEHIARICLDHEKIQAVRVTIDKPGALRSARSVAVEILRQK